MKFFNNAVSAFVVLIIFLLIIPLPTWLLDFMFITNLTISFVILLMTMYIKESLEISVYPSLLLITTLFRLALNVSSTRKILTNNGYAGEVVKTFGEFVIQGNVIVGLVIFLIIVLVQFIVCLLYTSGDRACKGNCRPGDGAAGTCSGPGTYTGSSSAAEYCPGSGPGCRTCSGAARCTSCCCNA